MIKIHKNYAFAFILIFILEALIALFVHDHFVRPLLGDALVVVLLYCLIRSFYARLNRLLPLYIFIFAALIEVAQFFNLVGMLHLSGNVAARVVIGTTFDLKDISCYAVGCLFLLAWEIRAHKNVRR